MGVNIHTVATWGNSIAVLRKEAVAVYVILY